MSSDMNNVDNLEFNVRFALQSFPDQRVQCPSAWSVLQLKKHISVNCLSKPEVKKQRLIYAGHCLRDEQILKDIFNKSVEGISAAEGLQVVHLVCTDKEEISKGSTSNTPRSDQFSAPKFVQIAFFDFSVPQQTGSQNVPAPIAEFAGIPQNVNEAYAMAYHNYLNNYYGRYSTLNNRTVITQTNAQNAAPPQAAENAAQVVENRRELNENPPDFLDLLYKLVRVAFLAAVILYSSLDRIIFVIGVICLMWYVQMRRERDNRNAANIAHPQQIPTPPAAAEGGADDNNNNEVPPQQQQPALSATTPWSVFWSTVVSFFSSLIPENPVPVNVN